MANAQKILVGNRDSKKPFRMPKSEAQDNIKCIREMWCETVGWIHLAEDVDHWRAVMDTVIKLRFHTWKGYF